MKDPDETMVNLWHTYFKDEPVELIKLSVIKLMGEFTYTPTIADVLKKVNEIRDPETTQMTSADSWQEIMGAVRKYGSYRETEALESFTPLTKEIVKKIGFKEFCMCEDIEVLRGQHRRIFDTTKERKVNNQLLPSSLQSKISQLSSTYDVNKLLGGGDTSGQEITSDHKEIHET